MNKALSAVVIALTAVIFSGCADVQAAPEVTSSVVASVDVVSIAPAVKDEVTTDICTDSDEGITRGEKELIALLTVAEAEDECETGKRLVIDTVLNRVDSEEFPDTVCGVIFEPCQFPSMTNGRADICDFDDDIYELVEEEIENRLCGDCLYFNSGDYPEWGRPLFRVQNHYFSGEGDGE